MVVSCEGVEGANVAEEASGSAASTVFVVAGPNSPSTAGDAIGDTEEHPLSGLGEEETAIGELESSCS